MLHYWFLYIKSYCLVIVLNFLHRQPNHLYKDSLFFPLGCLFVLFLFCQIRWLGLPVQFWIEAMNRTNLIVYCPYIVIFNKWLGVLWKSIYSVVQYSILYMSFEANFWWYSNLIQSKHFFGMLLWFSAKSLTDGRMSVHFRSFSFSLYILMQWCYTLGFLCLFGDLNL